MGILDFIYEKDLENLGAVAHGRWLVQPEVQSRCPMCGKLLMGLVGLDAHVRLEHPQRLPQLLLAGMPIAADTVFPSLPRADFWAVEDTREVRVRWEPGGGITTCLPDELGSLLGEGFGQRCHIELRGADDAMVVAYRLIDHSSLDTKTIATVEDLFLEAGALTLHGRDRAVEGFHHFGRALPPVGPGSASLECEYHEGLYRYLQAILLKYGHLEPTGESPVERMRQARERISWFRRPLSEAVQQVIRFNLNAFGDEGEPKAGNARLTTAQMFFAGRSARGDLPPADGDGPMNLEVPIDPVTMVLLDSVEELVRDDRFSRTNEVRIQGMLNLDGVTEKDRDKMRVLLLDVSLRRSPRSFGLNSLESLSYGDFAGWACRWLMKEGGDRE